jgi:hypothetical protein
VEQKRLPVARPADFRQMGHVLLLRQSDVLSQILLTLHQKKYRREIQMGVFDFSSEQLLARTAESMPDDALWSIEYEVTDVEGAREALEELDLAFDYRRETPSAPGIWVVLIDGFGPDNWELFRPYLAEGKEARLYVVAATQDGTAAWLPDGTFDTVIGPPSNGEE